MSRIFKKRFHPTGRLQTPAIKSTSPVGPITINMFDYDANNFRETPLKTIEECKPFKESSSVTWIDVEGNHPESIHKICDFFGIHPLVAEDIAVAGHRAKMEDYGDYLFIVLKMIYVHPKTNEIVDEQINIVLGENYVISFQEKEGDVFDPIENRIRMAKGRIRTMSADYLAYSLIDAIIDNYFIVLEKFGDKLEDFEDILLTNGSQKIAHEIHMQKRDIIFLRKQIWPLREMVSGIQRSESKLLRKNVSLYFRDIYDHVIQAIDTMDSFRDIISGMHDIYLSMVSNKLNEIMKVLTIFTATFIPLTFIAGIYGMNFKNMPELGWKYGYFFALGLMAFVGIGMSLYFKRKKWI